MHCKCLAPHPSTFSCGEPEPIFFFWQVFACLSQPGNYCNLCLPDHWEVVLQQWQMEKPNVVCVDWWGGGGASVHQNTHKRHTQVKLQKNTALCIQGSHPPPLVIFLCICIMTSTKGNPSQTAYLDKPSPNICRWKCTEMHIILMNSWKFGSLFLSPHFNGAPAIANTFSSFCRLYWGKQC